jgi:hypothetical protein
LFIEISTAIAIGIGSIGPDLEKDPDPDPDLDSPLLHRLMHLQRCRPIEAL